MSDNRTSMEASAHTLREPVGTTLPGTQQDANAEQAGRRQSDRIVHASASIQQAVEQATSMARSNASLVVIGPSGSGRRHFARAIHGWSPSAGGPLERFSASAIAEGMQSREIFGTDAGADAVSSGGDVGALARAAGGTLVIEQIDALGADTKHKLIRALQEGRFAREGGSESQAIRARIIATADARAEVDAGGLLGEVAAQTLRLDALADRREDILPLAAHFLSQFASEEGLEAVGFTVDARRWLVEEAWEGNVRELRERIRQAVGLSGSGSISAEALMLSTEGDEVPSFKEAKRAFEMRYVEGLLRRCSGNISRAARLAKKDRKDFYDVIRRTGVDPTQFRN
jgi:two-component system response regulator GlrR